MLCIIISMVTYSQALRVSMEEQRQRQQEETRRSGQPSDAPAASVPPSSHEGTCNFLCYNYRSRPFEYLCSYCSRVSSFFFVVSTDEAMLERALAMSIEDSSTTGTNSSSQPEPDFGSMTEDEQIAFALRMSMQDAVASRKLRINVISLSSSKY